MQKELHHILLEVQLALKVFCIVINRYIKPFKEWFKYVKVCCIIKLYSDCAHKLFFFLQRYYIISSKQNTNRIFSPIFLDIPTPKDERRMSER